LASIEKLNQHPRFFTRFN